jgi:hypothetical protein
VQISEVRGRGRSRSRMRSERKAVLSNAEATCAFVCFISRAVPGSLFFLYFLFFSIGLFWSSVLGIAADFTGLIERRRLGKREGGFRLALYHNGIIPSAACSNARHTCLIVRSGCLVSGSHGKLIQRDSTCSLAAYTGTSSLSCCTIARVRFRVLMD